MCFAPQVGIEPTTFWLTVRRNYRCATAEQNTLFIYIFNCNLFFLSSVGRHSGLHCHPNLFSETFGNHSFRQGPPDYFAVLLSKLHVKIEFIIIKAQKDASPSLRLSHDTGISQPSNTLSGTVNRRQTLTISVFSYTIKRIWTYISTASIAVVSSP